MLPIGGFAIAVALVGITSAFKDAPKTNSGVDTYSFEYQPPATDPYSIANVEDTANWVYNEDASGCGGVDKACALLDVPEDFVDASGTPTLKSSINIVAVLTGANAKVASTASTAIDIENQSN